MKCEETRTVIAQGIDRLFGSREPKDAWEHIQGCPACGKVFEDERRVVMASHDALSPLKLDRDLTANIIRRLPEVEGLEELPTPGAKVIRWAIGLSAAAAVLLAIFAGEIPSLLRGSDGTSVLITPATAQDQPNEVTVEKDGIAVTLQSDKREYVAGESFTIRCIFVSDGKIKKINSAVPTSLNDIRLTDSSGALLDINTVRTKDSPTDVPSFPPHTFATMAWALKLDTPDTYWFYCLVRCLNRDFPLSITFTIRRKNDTPDLSTPEKNTAELHYHLKVDASQTRDIREMAERTRNVFLRRINIMGLFAPEVVIQDDATIVVRIPLSLLTKYKEILGMVGFLEFKEVGDAELHNAHTYPSTSEGWVSIENLDRAKDNRSPYMNGKYILVKKEPIIDGTHVVSATTHPDSRPGSYVVSFALSNSGTLKFEEARQGWRKRDISPSSSTGS